MVAYWRGCCGKLVDGLWMWVSVAGELFEMSMLLSRYVLARFLHLGIQANYHKSCDAYGATKPGLCALLWNN